MFISESDRNRELALAYMESHQAMVNRIRELENEVSRLNRELYDHETAAAYGVPVAKIREMYDRFYETLAKINRSGA